MRHHHHHRHELLDPTTIEALTTWARTATRGCVCIIRSHAPGCGVSTLIRRVLETQRCEPMIVDTTGHPEQLATFLRDVSGSTHTTLERKKRVLVFDPIDGLFADQMTSRVVLEHLKTASSSIPIVCAGFLNRAPYARIMDIAANRACVPSLTSIFFDRIRDDIATCALRRLYPDASDDAITKAWASVDGDYRAAASALAMGEAGYVKDAVCDGQMAIARILFEEGVSLSEAMRLHDGDSQVMTSGIFENYAPLAGPPIDACAEIADGFSVADMLDTRIYGNQQWDLVPMYAAMTAGVSAVAIPKPRPSKPIDKVATVWSKSYNQRAKGKFVRAINHQLAERGHSTMAPEDLAYVREMLVSSMVREDPDLAMFCHVARDLDPSIVLHIIRLFVTKYTQNHHQKFKRYRDKHM